MKGGTKSRGFNTHKGEKDTVQFKDQQNQKLGLSITDLPRPISVDILLRLSVKRLLICKCVCKTWRNLILNPEFAKLQFARAEAYPLIRPKGSTHVSRTLYLVEPPEQDSGVDLSFCSCGDPLLCYRPHHHVNLKLDTKLKIPLRNAELVLNNETDANVNLHSRGGVKRKRCIRLRLRDHKFNVVNSCNGVLCLSEPSKNEPAVVCNPITGEYIELPVPTQADESIKFTIDCGLGFSPRTNQYKVIRMFDQENGQWTREPITGRHIYNGKVTDIHTLGTGSWKRLGFAPHFCKLGFTTFLNGALHWLRLQCLESDFIICFNFDVERFQSIPTPSRKNKKGTIGVNMKNTMSLGVLSGWLCICDPSEYEDFEIWVMKEYGVKESWTKEFHFINNITDEGRWLRGICEPMSYLRNGTILFFHHLGNAVFHYDTKGDFKFLKIRGIKSKFEAIAHIPSFISLKDAVTGDNLAMLNIKSRCAEVKVQGETKAVHLVEENADIDSDFNLSSDSDL